MNASFWRGRRILVTGHTGFKGAWLAYWLNHLGCRVSGFSLPPSTEPNLFSILNLGTLIDSTIGDIRDLPAVKNAVRESNAEIVFHLAAQPLVRSSYDDPLETFSTNVLGTANVMEAVRQSTEIKAAVIVTTDKCYINNEAGVAMREDFPLGGHDPYSASKACAEIVAHAYRASYLSASATAVGTARAGNVIGGGDWSADRIVPDFMRACAANRALMLRYPGAVRPWQHVLDALHGYIVLAENLCLRGREVADAFNFGPDRANARTVLDLVNTLRSALPSTIPIEVTAPADGKTEARYLMLDSKKANTKLGWAPQFAFDAAVAATAEWYAAHQDGRGAAETERQITRMMELVAA